LPSDWIVEADPGLVASTVARIAGLLVAGCDGDTGSNEIADSGSDSNRGATPFQRDR